jgi:hypothetical protein
MRFSLIIAGRHKMVNSYRRRFYFMARLLSVLCVVSLLGPGSSLAEGVRQNDLFEIGDGGPSFFPGAGDIIGSVETGPDWDDIFSVGGLLRDDYPYDFSGEPAGNGIPDFVDLYAGEAAVFMEDDVSLGGAIDTTAFSYADGVVLNAAVAPEHDLGNSYVYAAFDSLGNLVIYAGTERLAAGDSFVEFELNQAHIRLGHGPPWAVTGDRVAGDLLVRVTFAGGYLNSVSISRWVEIDPASGASGFVEIESLIGEGCNFSETLCITGNAGEIDGGSWRNFDTVGDGEVISANRFVEFGIAADAVLGSRPDYTSIQVRSPQDIAFGYFAEGK